MRLFVKAIAVTLSVGGIAYFAKKEWELHVLQDWEATIVSNEIPQDWDAQCGDGEHEMVYALMVTGKNPDREFLARRTYQDFERQTYPSKALVMILGDGFDLPVDNPCVLKLHIGEREMAHLGQLRNIALLGVPEGSVWVQWDDDDCHHPDLIAQQLAQMQNVGAPGCFLVNQARFYVHANITTLISNPGGGIMGTLMARKLPGLRYPNKAKGEDAPMAYAYRDRHAVFWDNPAGLYVRVIHGHNTWGAKKFGGLEHPGGYEYNYWQTNETESADLLASCGTLAGGAATADGLQTAMGEVAAEADPVAEYQAAAAQRRGGG